MAPTLSEPPAIEVRDVSKAYGPVRALDGVSFAIAAPATGLLGANGAGKSTLMRVVLGLDPPDAGSVTVLGRDSRTRQARRRIGYMPEHDCLPREMSARDFVVHMAELRGLTRREAAVRASEVLFQVGLDEERSRAMGTFSLGMRQRAKLAQALVHSPQIVLLDEPTAGLDPAGRVEMLALVRRLSTDLGVRVLLSSHVLEDVRHTCDEVVILAGGRLAGRAPVEPHAAPSGRLRVRVAGEPEALAGALAERGASARRDDAQPDLLWVEGDPPTLARALRDAAVAAGVGLRELRPAERTLEDVVVEAMG